MHLIISDHYKDVRHSLLGSEEEIKEQLCKEYPFLNLNSPLKDLVQQLDASQIATAVLHDTFSKSESGYHYVKPKLGIDNQSKTQHPDEKSYLQAIAMMIGYDLDSKVYRQALLQSDGDIPLACVTAANLDLGHIASLETLADYYKQQKYVTPDQADPVLVDVNPMTPKAQKFCDIIIESAKNKEIEYIKLVGKHSKGTLRVNSAEGTLLLKPGSGPQNPASGENENPASMTRREACFYTIGCAWGLGDSLVECHGVVIDGNEYAAEQMLSHTYRNCNDINNEDPGKARRLFNFYNDGKLHRFAFMDYVLGNPDRNAGNVMLSSQNIKLIDHGSAFSGVDFHPATDQYSFVPYYLRALCPLGFGKMPVEEKLKYLPRVSEDINKDLRFWIDGLSEEIVTDIMGLYGMNSEAVILRLKQIKAALSTQRADLAILTAWVV
jgi:hypothetical protein